MVVFQPAMLVYQKVNGFSFHSPTSIMLKDAPFAVLWGIASRNLDLCKTASMVNMGVSKNGGTPKCMVYNGKPYQNG